MLRELAIVLGAFALATALAELLGAVNLGTALAFGQIGFALAVVWVLLRADSPPTAGRVRAEARRRAGRAPS